MNPTRGMLAPARFLYRLAIEGRRVLPRQRCRAFGPADGAERIGRIYVINLHREPDRWRDMKLELGQILGSSGDTLTECTERFPAVDARSFAQSPVQDGVVDPFYTLREQLFVEPQPRVLPDQFELDRPILMSRPEVAVARSHVGVWRRIAAGDDAYALVLEDDAWFKRGFGRYLDRTWRELEPERDGAARFDMLYLSYREVNGGAQKALLSASVFRPVRGLWYLSGYVLSRDGARKLLGRLPCRGPVDLWVNRQFAVLDVRATRQSLIRQRLDRESSNFYSILPTLSRVGVLDCEGQSLFQIRPQQRPVFAFGEERSGLSSLAVALSMLGYRCCSDLQDLPEKERKQLLAGGTDRVFDAYVNIGSLTASATTLRERHPGARFIFTTRDGGVCNGNSVDLPGGLTGGDVLFLRADAADKWRIICEHLRCAPPVCSYPEIADLGQWPLLDAGAAASLTAVAESERRRDPSPWVVEPRPAWRGIRAGPGDSATSSEARVSFNDRLEVLDSERWLPRDDTFPGNLGLFRRANVECRAGVGALLSVRREPLGVRDYSAAALSSHNRFLFGRFEATFQASNVPGVVTGFFLHRDSPRQEIDVEIAGKRPEHLLVNVFYNPGDEGAKFDYGYRGAPSIIELGFDASESPHRFAIEWDPGAIRWLVDGQLIHERVNWNPTPIPRLPMTLHVNTWPSRSRELAGRLAHRRLPATAVVSSIAVEANGRTRQS
jgi:GR25 family glycosyltransferase involved in LPS biosynthesis